MSHSKNTKEMVQPKAEDGGLRRSGRVKIASESPQVSTVIPSPIRRGPGRPRKKNPSVVTPAEVTPHVRESSPIIVVPKRRGRPPKGIVNENEPPKASIVTTPSPPAARKRGRPARIVVQSTANAPANSAEFSLHNIVGTFVVQCRAVSFGWTGDYSHEMSLSVGEPDEDGHLLAAFDIGFVTGTMRIATSEEGLEEWCERDDEQDELQGPLSPYASPIAGTKRTRNQEDNAESPQKRVKVSKSVHAHRVYFCWRGQSPADGMNYVDEKAQSGWLDFPHADGNAFWGVIDLHGSAGPGIWFHGIRVDKTPAHEPIPWDEFAKPALKAEEDNMGGDQASTAVMTAIEEQKLTEDEI